MSSRSRSEGRHRSSEKYSRDPKTERHAERREKESEREKDDPYSAKPSTHKTGTEKLSKITATITDSVFNPTAPKEETEVSKLEAERRELAMEIEALEGTLRATTKKARRTCAEETYVWVLVEYENYGCERYLDGYPLMPPSWGVFLFRNKTATGTIPPVKGAEGILSVQSGKGKKNDDKTAVTYSAADMGLCVGDIAVRATQRGIAEATTVYFVCSPVVVDNPRFQQEMSLLRDFGIESHCCDGHGSLDDVMQREGEDISIYKTSTHRRPLKSRSRGPPAERMASLGRR